VSYDERISELGLELPPPLAVPPGVAIPFEWARLARDRVVLSGHGAIGDNGAVSGPFGKVPSEVSLPEAQTSARRAGLAMLASLRRLLGTLDRVEEWVMINGFVNADEGYAQTTAIINPVSDLVVEVFGASGRHARTAIGVAALPMNVPVIVAAEILIRP
jgi:enamine deaminase RidA (YjgF/YER057c/UK114 family)